MTRETRVNTGIVNVMRMILRHMSELQPPTTYFLRVFSLLLFDWNRVVCGVSHYQEER